MKCFNYLTLLLIILIHFGCAPSSEEENSSQSSYSVGGTVTGLSSGALVLQNNGGDDLLINQSGSEDISFNFPGKMSSGASYDVSVKIQPNTQTCSINKGSGTVNGRVSDLAVVCSSESFTVGGSISGLSGTVILQNNGGDNLTLSTNGEFSFQSKVAKGSEYFVSVKTNPSPLTCSASSNRGIIDSDIDTVSVTCSIETYLLSGTASGIGSSTLGLVHGGESINITDNGSDNVSFQFTTPVTNQGGYAITIPTQPDNRTCSVVNGMNDNVTSHITNLRAICWKYIDNLSQGGINKDFNEDAVQPAVSVYNNKLYVAWVENNGSKDVIRVSRNDDSNWVSVDNNVLNSTSGIITSSATKTSNPFLVLDTNSSITYMLWEDRVNDVDRVHFAWNSTGSSDDSIGKNWYLISSLNKNNSTNASSPMGLTKDGKLYVVWSEMSNTSQIRVRSVKDIQTIDSWLDGGGTTGINKNTDHHAKNPVILENLSVFYAAWSEENSTTSDNVSQIRVKKLDRSDNDSNTQWQSLSGENDVKGLNYNSNFSADHPQLIFHNSKLYSTWQEANSDGKKQIRVAFYQDNLTITDNGTKLILDNSSFSHPLNINRSNCSLNEFDDGENLIYQKLSNSNLDNKSHYFSNLDNVSLNNNKIYHSTITNSVIRNSKIINSTISNSKIINSEIYSSKLDNTTTTSSSEDNSTLVSVEIPDVKSSCWIYIDGGDNSAGLNKIVDHDGNENAINPDFIVHNSQLYLTWTQTKSSASQIRISLFNDNSTNPNWQIVDRYDNFGSSRFGLNYNTAKDASDPVMASTGSKLFTLWSEFDNKSNSQLRVVENQM